MNGDQSVEEYGENILEEDGEVISEDDGENIPEDGENIPEDGENILEDVEHIYEYIEENGEHILEEHSEPTAAEAEEEDGSAEEEDGSAEYSEAVTSKTCCTCTKVGLVILLFIIAALTSGVAILGALFFRKVSTLETSQQMAEQRVNKTIDKSDNNYNLFNAQDNTLSNSQTQLERKVDALINQVNNIQVSIDNSNPENAFSPGFPELPSSCSIIQSSNPSSTSGYYFIKSDAGQLRSVYCLQNNCGSFSGGWMRVAQLNVQKCPVNLKSKTFRGITTCVVNRDEAGCVEVRYSVLNVRYSKICGRIRAYTIGTLDGFNGIRQSFRDRSLTEEYLDGISVISSSLKHVWSFAAGRCECSDSNKPSYVDKWTCDKSIGCRKGKLCNPLLWSSQECGTQNSYFNKDLPDSTDDIIVRICRDQDRLDEDLGITTIELYVF